MLSNVQDQPAGLFFNQCPYEPEEPFFGMIVECSCGDDQFSRSQKAGICLIFCYIDPVQFTVQTIRAGNQPELIVLYMETAWQLLHL